MPNYLNLADIVAEDVLDLRDFPAIWEDAQDWDADDRADLGAAMVELASDLGFQVTPDDAAEALERHGDSEEPTLIAEAYFTEYAKQLADDIGAVSADAGWPNQFIDWEAAAEALTVDYQDVRFGGHDWMIR